MLLAVPGRVEGGVMKTEVGAQVEHHARPLVQVGHQQAAGPVGQSEEHGVRAVDQAGFERLEHQVPGRRCQARVERCHGRARLTIACGPRQLEVGVRRAQTQQLGARVARRSDDPDLDHPSMIRDYA